MAPPDPKMARLSINPSRYLRDTAVFAPCYVLLDWVSYIQPLGAFNITPWNPQPALAIAWMALAGLAYAAAVFVTILLADLLVRDLPGTWMLHAATAAILTLGYAGIALALRRLLRPAPHLRTLRQLTLFVAIAVPATALIAAGFVAALLADGQIASGGLVAGWIQFWVGDAVGILVTTPLLLVVADAESRGAFRLRARDPVALLQVALVAFALWLAFVALGGDPSHHVYLVFLPLIWIAIRNGLPGAVVGVAVVQIGVVLGIHHRTLETLPIIELQALVAALTLTALYLGVMVDERRRATESLQQSLRLAAASEMAGAIAHEVNQPLTALMNYGQAAQTLLARNDAAQLGQVMERMLAEARRASDVVKRLRDFFRQGTTRLEEVTVEELARSANAIAASLPGDIAIEVVARHDRASVLVDRLQIELVLRNLLANAAEAAAEATRGGKGGSGTVTLTMQALASGELQVVVTDSGPGLSADELERIFTPFVSGKPTGMGLGLAISRAIAEAHGGSLTGQARRHGEFHLRLPLQRHG
jgi:signal transduction histidine kinase